MQGNIIFPYAFSRAKFPLFHTSHPLTLHDLISVRMSVNTRSSPHLLSPVISSSPNHALNQDAAGREIGILHRIHTRRAAFSYDWRKCIRTAFAYYILPTCAVPPFAMIVTRVPSLPAHVRASPPARLLTSPNDLFSPPVSPSLAEEFIHCACSLSFYLPSHL